MPTKAKISRDITKKKVNKVAIIAACLSCLGASLPIQAYSQPSQRFNTEGINLPFENTAKGMENYANSSIRGGSKKVRFFNIGEGSIWKETCYVNPSLAAAVCGGGYVTVSDPLGKQTCELLNAHGLLYFYNRKQFEYKAKRCVKN